MLIIKEDRNEKHYCTPCAVRFIASARGQLNALEDALQAVDMSV